MSGQEPKFVEGDVFRIIVPLDDEYSSETATTLLTTQTATQTATQSSEQLIIALLKQEPSLSQKQIADRLNMNLNTVKYHVRKQQEQGRLQRIGTTRKGQWVVK